MGPGGSAVNAEVDGFRSNPLHRPRIQGAIGVAIIVAAFAFALPRFADYGLVWESIRGIDRAILPILAIVAAANLVAPTLSQLAALPGLRLGPALAVDWTTSTVTNLVPGGSAFAVGVTWSMYRSLGLAGSAIARSVVVTGVWDALVKLGTPLPALLWLATQRPVGPVLIQAAVLGAVFFVVAVGLGVAVLAGPGPSGALGRLLDRLPGDSDWPGRLDRLRLSTIGLLRTRGLALTVLTVAGHANLYLLLVVCLQAVGVERSVLGFAPILAAFAFGRLVTALPLTPGGLGVFEVGLVSALATVGDAPDAPVVAAVLLFRFASFAMPLPLGLAGWLWWTGRRDLAARAEPPSGQLGGPDDDGPADQSG